ncbi:unnamed protein product [Alopecurus aequalis]
MSLRPPPLRGRDSPPALIDDAMREIFLRFPPDDTKSLVRASAVCKSWRGILSDDDFQRLYRAFHRRPPLLGFLYNTRFTNKRPYIKYSISHFVSAAPSCPLAFEDRRCWHVLDSRHGLVLFYTPKMDAEFVVSDLVTGDQWEIHVDPKCEDIMWWGEDEEESLHCNAAVLCANDRYNHLVCHGGPFRVALVGSVEDGGAHATVYSSETGAWSDMISVENPSYINARGHSAVLGNKVYVPCLESDSVVEYNMDEHKLSVIVAPFEDQDQPYIELMGVEDGMLLFATVVKPRLYLWSMDVGPSRAVGWALHRIIELELWLPHDVFSDRSYLSAVGFVEGDHVIFLSTKHGLYKIDLNSSEGEKVHERWIEKVLPYMSFYTEAWGRLLTLK